MEEVVVTLDESKGRKRGVSIYFNDVRCFVRTDGEKGKGGWLGGCLGKEGEMGKLRKEILHGVSGYVKPGEMLAVMGPSGSGKTTFLNAMAGRANKDFSGELLFGGRERDRRTRRKIAYVTQEDLFFSKVTVKEVLTFTANVRLPESVSRKEKAARVEEIMAMLRLTKAADTKIGDGLYNKGVSGGERKRVSIANELLTDPAVLLLDEPTSGLDASTALTVVRIMKRLASEGKTIVSTIHQPSSQIFAEFDKLLLLSEGNTVYFGDAKSAYDYFSGLGHPCPFGYNYADFYLQLLTDAENSAGVGGEKVRSKLIESWREKEKRQEINHTLVEDEEEEKHGILQTLKWTVCGANTARRPNAEGDEAWNDSHKYVTTWGTQFRSLCGRAFRQKRGTVFEIWPIVQALSAMLLSGLIWFQMESTDATIQDRVGLLFFSAVFWAFFALLNAAFSFPAEKNIIRKDRSSGAYCLSAYFVSKSLIEIPLEMIYPFVYAVVVYWMAGLNPRFSSFVIYVLLLTTHVVVSHSIGICISAAVMDVKKSTTLATVFMLASMMVSGFYVATENLPSWIRWAQSLSFVLYTFSAMVVNEFDGQTYSCSDPRMKTQYQIDGCPVTSDTIFDVVNVRSSLGVWGNYGIMLAFLLGAQILGYIFLRYFHRKHKTA